MWTRKVSKRGNAVSISLPAQLCRDLEINRGDIVVVNYDKAGWISLHKLSPEQIQAMREIYGKDMQTIKY